MTKKLSFCSAKIFLFWIEFGCNSLYLQWPYFFLAAKAEWSFRLICSFCRYFDKSISFKSNLADLGTHMGKCLENASGDQIKIETFFCFVLFCLIFVFFCYVKKAQLKYQCISDQTFVFYMGKNHIKYSHLRGNSQKQKHFMTHY